MGSYSTWPTSFAVRVAISLYVLHFELADVVDYDSFAWANNPLEIIRVYGWWPTTSLFASNERETQCRISL